MKNFTKRFMLIGSLAAAIAGCVATDSRLSRVAVRSDSKTVPSAIPSPTAVAPKPDAGNPAITQPNGSSARSLKSAVTPNPSSMPQPDAGTEGQRLRIKGRSMATDSAVDGPAVFAEFLKKLRKENSKQARQVEDEMLGKSNGLARLFVAPDNVSDPFERKRAEDAFGGAVSGMGGKFVAKFGKPLSAYKFRYTGPAWFESYDFKKQEIRLVLCGKAMDRFSDDMRARFYDGASYYFDCHPNDIFEQGFSGNGLVDAARDLGVGLALSPNAYQQRFLPPTFVSMPHTVLSIKAVPAVAEHLRKKGVIAPRVFVKNMATAFIAANSYALFAANIDLEFDNTAANIRRIGSSPTVAGIYVLLRPTKVCLENILREEKYMCEKPISSPNMMPYMMNF